MAAPSTASPQLDNPLRPSEMALAIQTCFKANRSVMLHGQPGVGKSDLVMQAADREFAEKYGYRVNPDYSLEEEIKPKTKAQQVYWRPVTHGFQRPWFVDFRTALHDSVDLSGLPNIKDGQTQWAIPKLLPTDPRGGVFFLDEINRGNNMTQNACFSLVLDGRIGEYRLPEEWRCASAVNDLDVGAGKMSAALTRRFTHLDADTNLDDVVNYAEKRLWEPMVIAFLKMFPQHLNQFDPKLRVGPNPRAWEFVSKLVGQGLTHKRVLRSLIAGNVGNEIAIEFLAFLDLYEKLPAISEVLANPHTTKVPSEPGLCFALASALARRVTVDTWPNAMAYLERMQMEFSCYAIKNAVERNKALTLTKTYTSWCVKNADVVL